MRRRPRKALKVRCLYTGCREEAHPYFCPAHWPMLTSATRREVVQQFVALKERGQQKPPPPLLELLDVAFAEIDVHLKVSAAQ